MDEKNYSRHIFLVLLFLCFIVCGTLFKVLSSVFLPICIATLLTFVFMPIIQRFNSKLKLPWVPTVLLVELLFLIILVALFSLLFGSLTTIVTEYPKYESKFLAIYQIIAEYLNLEFDAGKSFLDNIWGVIKVRQYVQKFAIFLSSGVVNFSKHFFIIILMSTFLLLEVKISNKKINAAFKGNTKGKVLRITGQVIAETVRYISIKFFISLTTGILVSIGTFIIGLDFPIVWGFLAFLMNFIPTFGSIISSFLTTLLALLQFYPSWGKVIYVLLLMITVNMVLGNVVEPRIEGKHLGLSPFVILVSLTIWGWIWGFVGMILAVPMTVIIKIICENVSYLQGIAIFLGNTPRPPVQPDSNQKDSTKTSSDDLQSDEPKTTES